MRSLGFHVSISGGLHRAVPRARERECTCVQIFCGNPRAWNISRRSESEVSRFVNDVRVAQLDPVVVHACYLINPCSPNDTTYEKSINRLRAELETAARIHANYYVIHPGSSKQQPDEWALARSTHCFIEACKSADSIPHILLENTAGAYGPGRSFHLMAEIAQSVQAALPDAKLGTILDTCHAFAAGYDLGQMKEVDRLATDIDNSLGLNKLRLLHLNDSLEDAGSRRDRHTHIGEGQIGVQGFHHLLSHDAFCDIPAVLETPWESVEKDVENITRIRNIIAGETDDQG